MKDRPLLEVNSICASFARKRLLNHVSFSVDAGEVHAIIGCNGSGKTLFGKCVSGIVKPSSGTINFDGKDNVIFKNPVDAVSQGIIFCMQDLNLLDNQTISDNLYAGLYSGIIINKTKIYQTTKSVLEKLNISADPQQLVETLSLADKYLLQFGRCLISKPKLIILDEITATLTQSECTIVFKILQEFRKSGVAIIYISHNINEVIEIADKVTVIKDGQVVNYFEADAIQDKILIQAMLGNVYSEPYPKLHVRQGETILEVSHIKNQYVHDFSFSLHEGEIIGIAGTSGSGRTKLIQTLVGIEKIEAGDIIYNYFEDNNQNDLPYNFVGYIPEDRDRLALFDTFSSVKNVTVRNLKQFSHVHIIKLREEEKEATELISKLGIKYSGPYDKIKNMSNGTKQKLVMSQCLHSKCMVYLFDEPTQNVDISSKIEIYNIMNELVLNGAGIVMVSSDFSELTNMCDRILIIKKGSLIDDIPASSVTPESLLSKYLI